MRLTNRLHSRLLISRQRVQCLIAWKNCFLFRLVLCLDWKTILDIYDFRIYKESYGKPLKHGPLDWVAKVVFLIQILLIFGDRCNRYFWDIRLKMYGLPYFNMLFQLVLTKVFIQEKFSCLPKVDNVIN